MLGIVIAVLVRCMLVALFLPFSALDKVLNFETALTQASRVVPSRVLAVVLIAGGFCVEVGMSLAILTGIADRLAALVLAAYCVITACLWKQFWATRGAGAREDLFWDFFKNVALAGGFLLLAFGSNADSAARFLHDPLASSHPYAVRSEQP